MLNCPNCGTANPDGSRFCVRCGHDLSKVSFSPPNQPTIPEHPPATTKQVHSTTLRARLGKSLKGAEILLAVISTVIGALASIISDTLLSRVSSLFSPFILTIGVTVLALFATLAGIVPMAIGVFKSRAVQRELKRKRLLEKEKDFFLKVNEDTSLLLNKGSGQYAE